MRKPALIWIFCLLMIGLKAQVNYNWFPTKPGVQYNFKIDSSIAPISNVLMIDSVSTNSWCHYNKIVTHCDTCINSHLVNDAQDSTYVLNAQPQFLQHKFIKTNDASFYFKGKSALVLKPFSTVGATWLYDSTALVNATLVAKSIQTVLGNSDSVCVIKLSNADTIVMTRDHGVIQFPYRTTVTHYYKLVGAKGAQNSGLQMKRFHDFFDFNVGDVLQFEFTDTDFNILPPKFTNGHERWDILSAQIYVDSSLYHIRQTYFDSVKYGAGVPAVTSFSTYIDLVFKDSTQHLANLVPHQEIMTNPYYIYNNGQRGIHRVAYSTNAQNRNEKSFGENCPNTTLAPGNSGAAELTTFANVFINRNHRKIVGRKVTEGLGFTSELYNDGDRIYQKCLIGYIKGTDTTGIIYEGDPLQVKTNKRDHIFHLAPNPADKTLIVRSSATLVYIFLTNAMGEKVAEYKGVDQIDVSTLPNGIYFATVSDGQFLETRKIIVLH